MPAECVEVANALTTHINGGTYTAGPIVAVREWVDSTPRNQLTNLRVSVGTDLRELVTETRGANRKNHIPFVVIQKKISAGSNTDPDSLALLVEQLEERVNRDDLVVGSKRFKWTEQTQAFLDDASLNSGVFWAFFQVTYQLIQ